MGTLAISSENGEGRSAETNALRQSVIDTQAKLRTKEDELTKCRSHLSLAEHEVAETHHRIANSLHLIITFLRLQERSATAAQLKDGLLGAISRVEAVARLHMQLRKRSATASMLDLGAYVTGLAEDLSSSLCVQCKARVERVDVEERLAIDLAIAINELAVNAAKYGRCDDGSANIEIGCGRDDTGNLRITVKDGGRGFPDHISMTERGSLGLRFVRSIINHYGGELLRENSHGARMTLLIPLGGPRNLSRTDSGMPPS